MRELTLNTTVAQLSINGSVYTAQKSDVEIIELASAMRARYAAVLTGKPTNAEVVAVVKEAADCIDQILGDGAMAAISGGKPVSIRDTIRWLNQIATAVTEEYAAKLVEQYG